MDPMGKWVPLRVEVASRNVRKRQAAAATSWGGYRVECRGVKQMDDILYMYHITFWWEKNKNV